MRAQIVANLSAVFPASVIDDLFDAYVKSGWLAATHANKGRFYVTQSGRAALKKGIEA
jgi:predicted transcriptional regulator